MFSQHCNLQLQPVVNSNFKIGDWMFFLPKCTLGVVLHFYLEVLICTGCTFDFLSNNQIFHNVIFCIDDSTRRVSSPCIPQNCSNCESRNIFYGHAVNYIIDVSTSKVNLPDDVLIYGIHFTFFVSHLRKNRCLSCQNTKRGR